MIGPDVESEQWVTDVVRNTGARFAVLRKERRGDTEVEIHFSDTTSVAQGTPILLDDILSTGETMLRAIQLLRSVNARVPVCIAVHGVFAEGAYEKLGGAGARLVTSSTIPHETNGIDVVPLVATVFQAKLRNSK